MDFSEVTRYRKIVAAAGAVCCALFFLAILDGVAANFRHPADLYSLVRGESTGVNGPLPEGVEVGQLKAAGGSEGVRVSFDAPLKGYWLGNSMWRGTIAAGASAESREYTISVYPGEPAGKPLSVFRVRVFASREDLLRSSESFLASWFGASPWYVAGAFAALLLPCFGAVYLISGKKEAILASQGEAEVYRVVPGPAGSEVYFALGTRHGVGPGAYLTLFGEEGVPLGKVKVLQSTETDSVAQAEPEVAVRTGFVVSTYS